MWGVRGRCDESLLFILNYWGDELVVSSVAWYTMWTILCGPSVRHLIQIMNCMINSFNHITLYCGINNYCHPDCYRRPSLPSCIDTELTTVNCEWHHNVITVLLLCDDTCHCVSYVDSITTVNSISLVNWDGSSDLSYGGDQFSGTFTEVKQRRPRLVLGWVTVREDRALWTCFRSSVWTLICDRPSI